MSGRKTKDPNAPKRPTTPFFVFSGEKRAAIKSANPDFKIGDVAKELGRMWREMTPAQKAPYEKKAKADKVRYEKEKAAYEN